MGRPSLSIIIPSCNRHQYLISILGTLLKETTAELVVSDNSDKPLESVVIDSLGAGSRLIYQYHAEQLSVVDNFERALRLSTGQFLIFIGDDDCIGPGIEDIVHWASQNDVDAVVSYGDRFIANYFWPGVTSKYFGDGYAGKMFLARYTGQFRLLDAKAAIRDAAGRPGSGLGSMARAYHGMVSRKLVDRVIEKYGKLFGGVSPDIYSATLLSHEAHRAVVVDHPFVVPGASPRSTAGEGAARQDTDKLKGREHIRRFGAGLQWDPRVPEFYSPVTVWSYSHQQALDLLNDPSFSINFPRLYMKCIIQYWGHRNAVAAAVKQWLKSGKITELLWGGFCGVVAEFEMQISRVWYRFLTPPAAYGGLETIGDAYRVLSEKSAKWTGSAIVDGASRAK